MVATRCCGCIAVVACSRCCGSACLAVHHRSQDSSQACPVHLRSVGLRSGAFIPDHVGAVANATGAGAPAPSGHQTLTRRTRVLRTILFCGRAEKFSKPLPWETGPGRLEVNL